MTRLDGEFALVLCRDGGCEVGLYSRALATRQAASQLGPQLLDVVVKRDHRPFFCFEEGAGGPRRSGRVKVACAAKRGAGEPILPRVEDNRRALARSLRAAKLGETASSLGRLDRRGTMGELKRENGRTGVRNADVPRPDCSGRGDVVGGDQSPLDLRPRDQMRLKVSPPSSSNRLAKIGVVKLGSSSLTER